MRRMLVGATLAVAAVGVRAQQGAQSSSDEWGKLASSNDLELKGNTPFHLAMTFQLFDMDGKPTETGSFEEWWAAPGSSRVVVHLAGLKEDGSAPEGAAPAVVRDGYLVSKLVEVTVRPVVASRPPGEALKQGNLAFGKTHLRCVTRQQTLQHQQGDGETLCTDPDIDDVRAALEFGGSMVAVRNSIRKFHGTYTALEPQISLFGRSAITGTVTALQNFDPATSEVKLPPPASESVTPGPEAGHVPAKVMAGRRLSFVEPNYPDRAKMQHQSGKVILGVVIGADGAVHALTPIASTDAMFTDTATEAVKKWKYSPYLLNGVPTEVDTTITVSFQVN